MKLILLMLLALPLTCFSQKTKPNAKKSSGFAYLGVSSLINDNLKNKTGITAGAGIAPESHVSIGAGSDFFVFNRDMQYLQPFADFRGYFAGLDKPASPYIAVQPGFIVYNKKTGNIKTQGSFAFNVLAGFMGRPKKGIGLFLNAGYSNISFLVNKSKVNYGGLKIEAGIAF